MSKNTLEKVLWDITVDPAIATDAAALDKYRLEPDERRLLETMSVREMADYDVDQMLIWMAWVATRGFAEAPEYMRRMNASATVGE